MPGSSVKKKELCLLGKLIKSLSSYRDILIETYYMYLLNKFHINRSINIEVMREKVFHNDVAMRRFWLPYSISAFLPSQFELCLIEFWANCSCTGEGDRGRVRTQGGCETPMMPHIESIFIHAPMP